jgi:hypothetical protein
MFVGFAWTGQSARLSGGIQVARPVVIEHAARRAHRDVDHHYRPLVGGAPPA